MSSLPNGLLQLIPESFLRDAQRLLKELASIWDAFLRAQLLLSLIMGAVIGVVTALLGVRYALIIGLMAFLAEFVPIIGANVIGIVIFFVAYFQPSNWLGLSPIVYAVVVVAIAGSMQQIKGYTIVPRIMGDRLKIHPVIMIVGALIGFALLGILGLLLTGPFIATTRLFGNYVRAKLLDLPPWPEPEETKPVIPAGKPAICRPARENDKADVLEMTARTWDGHDYIPQVWDEWRADRAGILAAAEMDGKVVGIGKLTRLAAGEWWIEGLRVHPDFQGMKIGSSLFEYLLAAWTERGGGTIRLATSSERVQVHHLCGRLGFRHVDTRLVMAAAPTRRGENAFEAIAEADAAAAFAHWQQAACARDGAGLVNTGWRWSRLTEDRVREFVRRGRAWWWKNRAGILFLYDSDHERRSSLEIAAECSAPAQTAAMLGQARRLADITGAERLAWAMPNLPAVARAARRAGFAQDWDGQLWIFERSDLKTAESSTKFAHAHLGRTVKPSRSRRAVR